MRETLDDMNQRMLAAAEQLSPEEASAVVRFLQTVREIVEIPGVGHSLVIDSHWSEVADAALAFLRRHDL